MARVSAGGTGTRGPRRPSCPSTRRPRHGPARGRRSGPASQVAPWAVASERLSDLQHDGLVDERAGDGAGGAPRRGDAGRLLPRQPDRAAGRTRTSCAPSATSSGWTGTTRRTASRRRPTTARAGFSPSASSSGVLTLAAVVVACIWQHRAASAGRALGIPSRRSPAWGVGSWFVPVVNLWMPYSAVRDCLPPDDPHRPRVLHWWIAWLVAASLSSAAGIVRAVLDRGGARPLHPGRAGLPGGHRLGRRASSRPSRRPTGTLMARQAETPGPMRA